MRWRRDPSEIKFLFFRFRRDASFSGFSFIFVSLIFTFFSMSYFVFVSI
jgi:hypothetical protein